MAAEIMPLPDEIREAARNHSYGNRREEVEAIDAVDSAVWAKTRVHESFLARQADELNGTAQRDLDTGMALLHDTAALAIGVVSGDIIIDQQSAKDYQAARKNVSDAIAELQYLKRRIEFSADKAADPYKSLSEILAKYSTLRGGRGWSRDGM